MIQDTCLGCHGVQGQRQLAIDRHAATGACGTLDRETVNAVPYPPDDPVSRLANYGALARDGVSCAACHRMVVGKRGSGQASACAAERVRGGAASGAQSGPHRLRQDLHRQLFRRAARPILRTVPGSQEEEHACGDRQQPGARPARVELRDVRLVSHRAPAHPAPRAEDRSRLRADHLSGMGVQRLPHRRDPRRRAAAWGRPAGAVLPELPHAQQGSPRKPVSQQDRGDPGVHELSASRAHARCQGHRSARAYRLRRAHAGRPQLFPAENGVAVPRHSGRAPGRSDDERSGGRSPAQLPAGRSSTRPSIGPPASPSARSRPRMAC